MRADGGGRPCCREELTFGEHSLVQADIDTRCGLSILHCIWSAHSSLQGRSHYEPRREPLSPRAHATRATPSCPASVFALDSKYIHSELSNRLERQSTCTSGPTSYPTPRTSQSISTQSVQSHSKYCRSHGPYDSRTYGSRTARSQHAASAR